MIITQVSVLRKKMSANSGIAAVRRPLPPPPSFEVGGTDDGPAQIAVIARSVANGLNRPEADILLECSLLEGSREYGGLKFKPKRMRPSDDSAAVPFATAVNVRTAALTSAFPFKTPYLRATLSPCSTRPTACALAGPTSRLVEVGFPSTRTHGDMPWSEPGP